MKNETRQHPADSPKWKKVRCPDYLKAPWASEQSRIYARILDERAAEARKRGK